MIDFLKRTFLFRGVDDRVLEDLLKHNAPVEHRFKRGDLIYPINDTSMVGFLVSGRCEVRRDRFEGGKIVLNVLEENDSFGILSIYSADEFPTQVFALKSSRVLFFTDTQIEYFVNNSSQISSNLIKFMANRISFLNKKIATFSGQRVEDRLAAYILCKSGSPLCDSIAFNCQKASEEINSGRASVYRAIASLEEDGLIKFVDKKIYIIDRNGLERI